MTACSGLSCSVSTLDSGSFPSLPRRGTTLRFLKDNSDRFGVCTTGCRKRHNGRVLLRTRIHKDLGRSIEFVARCYEQDGPRLPISVVDDRDRSFKVCWESLTLIIVFYSAITWGPEAKLHPVMDHQVRLKSKPVSLRNFGNGWRRIK